eukprot:gene7306-7519_t
MAHLAPAGANFHTHRHATTFRSTPRVPRASIRVYAVDNTVEAPITDQPTDKPNKQGYKDAIVVQSFGWDSCRKNRQWYNHILSKVPDLQKLSCTHIWLPPPSQSVSAEGYMPGQLYNLDSMYGSAEELKKLNKALTDAGICPMADIVINHRCADEMVDGKWNKFRDDVDHNNTKIDWGKWAITGNDPHFGGTGNPDTGENYGPAPDLDHANPELRQALKEWLGWLQKDVGFQGWRLDFVKGYGASFVDEYISATVGKSCLNVGEFWVDMAWAGSDLEPNQNAARQKLCDWVNANGHSAPAFDFPTKGILQEAIKKNQLWRLQDSDGKPPGLIGWWPSKAVTFIDNHDTGSTQQHWPFPADRVGAGYAYIMTHPGMPCVFWDHYFDWGSELRNAIRTLAAIRRRNGIISDSSIKILAAESDLYVAEVAGSVTLKLGARYDMGCLAPKESDGWKVATWGKDFCVWEKHAQTDTS